MQLHSSEVSSSSLWGMIRYALKRTASPALAGHQRIKLDKQMTESTMTWFDFAAVLVNIVSACLSKQDIIAEIRDLHLLEVKHLIPASFCLNIITLFSEAAQDLATTSLKGFTHIRA